MYDMAASGSVKIRHENVRSFGLWLVTVTAATTVLLLLPTTVNAQQIDCYYCEADCDIVNREQTERCAIECGTWFSSAGNSIKVHRGCVEYAPDDATLYQRCAENLCNDETPVRCLRCDSVYSSECQEVVCSTKEDQCYLNPADGHRGCTSDPGYEPDCLLAAGDGTCSLCTPTYGRSCNDNIRCVICDGSSDEECLEDPVVQACPSATDHCFRYLGIEQTLHMGCTSDRDYQDNCNQPRNCRTCDTNECNRDDVFACYSCSDCYSIDTDLISPIECTIFETNRCYIGYDWQAKLTFRGCASQEMFPYDASDLCTESGCNVNDFPVHLQCYQCADCDQTSPDDVSYCQSESATGCFMLLSESAQGTRTLVRGCNTDTAYEECIEDQNCVTCRGTGCNGGPKTVPLLCTRCSGVEQCQQSANPPSCSDLMFYNRCYMYSDADGNLLKGCLLDLEPGSEVAAACYNPDDARCQYCSEFNCNQQHCVSCDSRKDGLPCILGLLGGTLRYEMCTGGSGGCRVAVDAEGHTVRGCIDPLAEDPCEATLACEQTQLSGSNGNLFPPERRLCYQCDGNERCHEQQTQTSGQYCAVYHGPMDGCYIYNDGNVVVRGCTTDPDARCQTGDDPACRVWSESLSNGALQEPTFSCYQNCPGGDTSELVPSCPPVTCSASDNRCFLSVSGTGVISRGCTTSMQGCPPESRDCFLCLEPNCNGAYAICAMCDTEQDEDCTVAREHGDVCEAGDGCFHYVNAEREVFGCAESAPTFCTNDAAHCHFCQDELFCNAQALAVCYSCTDCDDVNEMTETKVCPRDTCFAGLFGTRVDRGCYSDMPEGIEQYRELQHCAETSPCNNIARSEWTSCYVCTDCPGEPAADAAQLCLNPLSNRCYTLLGTDGLVRRGCVGDPEGSPEGCEDGLNCVVCTGADNCNGRAAGTVPTPESPGFSCVRCAGESCADYNQLELCPNERGLLFDRCVTYDDGTDVRKGCLSDVAIWELCPVDVDGPCTLYDAPHGNARPIRCFTCSGTQLACVQQQLPGSVEDEFEHGGCVVFTQDDGTVVRGNTDGGRSCATNGATLCYECYTDHCNGELFPSDRLSCYQCRGEDCAQLTAAGGSSIVPQLCLGYDVAKRQCYTRYVGQFDAERGCLGSDVENVCTEQPCLLCGDDGCNNADYESLPQSDRCLSCSSNLACVTNPINAACTDPSRGCYTFVLGLFVVAKGCVSNVDPSSAWYGECTPAGGSERCEHCTGDNCNDNRCFVCTSQDDERCFEPTFGLVASSACSSGECVAFIDDAGHIVRGCADDYTEQSASVCSRGSEACLQCAGDYCNRGAMPRNRIKCYQCSGTDVHCFTPAKDSAKYCRTYAIGAVEECYTYFEDANTVQRGCVAELDTDGNEYYQLCSTTECNNQPALVPNTLRCVKCDNAEHCQALPDGPQQCTAEVLLGRPDRCYTFVDADGTVSGRGCLSQLTDPEAARCKDREDATCKLCSTDACNSASVKCVVCDSLTNPSCAGSVPPGSYDGQCGTGRCVSLVKATTTWKGCAEDFEDDCTAQDVEANSCAIFDGNYSNNGIFPADRLQCYQCEGDRNTCGLLSADETPKVCQRYEQEDKCYTYVADSGQTVRGCTSDPSASKECTADASSYCIRCEEEGCNSVSSEQPAWLSCAKCSQAAQCTERERSPVFARCTGTVLLGRTDSCYTYSFGAETLERGCLSEAEPTIRARCTGTDVGECSVCLCDRCNGPPATCTACESAEGCGDVLGPAGPVESCRTGSCVAFTKQIADAGEALMIVKGCSERHEADTCRRGPPGDQYQLCQSAECNDVLFPPQRVRCYQCEGEACANPSLLPAVCEPYLAVPSGADACYSFVDRQQKGCVGQLSLEQRVPCLEGDGTECTTCSSADGCNVEPRAQQCTVCSSETDLRCASSEWTEAPTPPGRKLCLTGGCATFIDSDGFTVKDCAADHQLTEAACAENSDTCFVCTGGDGCNDAVRLPSDRLECFQCSGADCVDVVAQKPTVCRRYDPDDSCYTYAPEPGSVVRGCLSDRPSCADEPCVTCTTPNAGCNSQPALVANTHSCYQCAGRTECAQSQAGPGTTCAGPILLGRTDACYTSVDRYTVRRGCLSAEDACDPSIHASCHVCTTGRDCNGDGYEVATHQCIQCAEAANGAECLWGYSTTDAIRCPEPTPPANSDGCYSCYEGAGSTAAGAPFRRGCVGDDDQHRCRNDTTLAVCLGTGCNNRNVQLQICAKCDGGGCDADTWIVEECRGTVPYARRGCYLLRDSRMRILARGCVAELSDSDWQRCLNARDGSCITCLDNQCNQSATLLGSRLAAFVTFAAGLLISFLLRP